MTDNTTPDNTEESVTQVTPDNTEENGGEDQDLSGVGAKFEEASRAAKLAKKEASKYNQYLVDGEVDLDGIKTVYRGNSISDKALELFCEENELDINDIKEGLSNPLDEIQKLRQEIESLKQPKAQEPTFTDILKAELEKRGVSNSDFIKYKDEFEEELEDLEGLETGKAIAKALNYVLKPKSAVKVVRQDAKDVTTDETWSKDKYMSYLTNRTKSGQVTNDQAVAELTAYEEKQKAKGLPLFK